MRHNERRTGFLRGLIYGLAPHTFCILFVVFSLVGATAATSLLKQLFYLPYFIEIVIGLALVSATISALIYLRRNGLLTWRGIRFKRKYLALMYATTIAVNLLFFWVIFPAVANLDLGVSRAAGADTITANSQNLSSVTLQVDIPCPGHAPLVIGELEAVSGVASARYDNPDRFEVRFDATRLGLDEILALPVFEAFAATVVS